MRRKLFLFAVILTGAVFLITGFYPDIWVPKAADEDKAVSVHEGRIINIRDKTDHYVIEIQDERGFRVRINYYESIEAPWDYIGCRIVYKSKLNYGDPARNPHCFNYRRYLRSADVYLTGTVRSFNIKEQIRNPYVRYLSFLAEIRSNFEKRLPISSRGMIMGMLFGDTAGIDEEVYDDFKRNGTAHILAVSGLHIGLLFSVYERITGGKTSKMGTVILAFMMYSYGTLAFWSPSVIRAEMMILMKTAARIKELRYDSLTAMSVAAVFLMIRNPYVIYGIGFQMSFLAIISINIVSSKLPDKIPKSLSQTISVNLSMILYQAYVFNYISPFAVLINLPVLYAAGIAIPAAFCSFALYAVSYALGRGIVAAFIMIPASSVTEMMVWLNSFLTFGGRNSWDIISPPAFIPALVTGAMLFLCSEYSGILRLRGLSGKTALIMLIIVSSSFLSYVMLYEPVGRDEIVFVDVGQGACTHIRAGSLNALIDGGGNRDRNVGEKVLKPYLLKNSVRSVDLSLATHEDIDHIKGLEELADCFKADKPLKMCSAGKRFDITDDIHIDVLWPLEHKENTQKNENSSVFMIDYQGIKVMVTGDLDMEGEKNMIRYYDSIGRGDLLKADVLNVGHHGSHNSTSDELLDAVSPTIAVIQVGRNNYGHPREEVLERLRNHGIKIFRNDKMGAVGLDLDDKNVMHTIKSVHVMIGDGC